MPNSNLPCLDAVVVMYRKSFQEKMSSFGQTTNLSPGTPLLSTQLTFSRIGIDFGGERKVVPTHYTFNYASSGNYCCPRTWLFQGTNDEKAFASKDDPSQPNENPAEGATWETIDERKNDTTFDAGFASHTFEIAAENRKKPFRLFRIVQTGFFHIKFHDF